MPETAAVLDAFAAEFGEVRLLHAEENGLTWGTRQPEGYAVSVNEMECYALHRREQEAAGRTGVEPRQSRAGARGQAPVRGADQGSSNGRRDLSRVAYGSAQCSNRVDSTRN